MKSRSNMRCGVGEALMKLIAEKLTSVRGGAVVFSEVSFEVASGEALVLGGPNGAGKTTLIRIVAGLLQPAAGKVRLEGGEARRTLAEECHYVGHLNAVKSNLSVEENALFWNRFLADGRTGAAKALATFGLTHVRDIPAAYLSAGQKRRLGLARLLVAKRLIWLLDEPTVSLDRASQAALLAVIDAHVAAGGMVVAASHVTLGLAAARQLQLGSAAHAA
jgi:heme exporter protein A